MILRPMSDLHLEWADFTIPELPNDAQSVLILAGDILVVDDNQEARQRYRAFLKRAGEQFQQVVYVLGNHEHYYSSLMRVHAKLDILVKETGCENIFVLQNDYVSIPDDKGWVTFLGATLWTDCGDNSPFAPVDWHSMNDSKYIRTGPNATLPYQRKFSAHDSRMEHAKSKSYLLREAKEYKDKGHRVVCISHHGISEQSVAERYKFDDLNKFYKSDMDFEIAEANPDFWFHGHMHNSSNYLLDSHPEICATRVVVNPRGYAPEGREPENPDFDPTLTFIL